MMNILAIHGFISNEYESTEENITEFTFYYVVILAPPLALTPDPGTMYYTI